MFEAYSATYNDKLGEEKTTIYNDGKRLSMSLRGVDFYGASFDSFYTSQGNQNNDISELFPLTLETAQQTDRIPEYSLVDYALEWKMPIQMVVGSLEMEGSLHVQFSLQGHRGNQEWGELNSSLSLQIGASSFSVPTHKGDFYVGLIEMQKQLPPGISLKSCLFCAFSSGYPYGMNPFFAARACFRQIKAEIIAIKYNDPDEAKIIDLWDKKVEYVQETYLCPEFQRDINFKRIFTV